MLTETTLEFPPESSVAPGGTAATGSLSLTGPPARAIRRAIVSASEMGKKMRQMGTYTREANRDGQTVNDLLRAVNDGDVVGVLGCFEEQADVDAFGMLFRGREEITEWVEAWILARGVRFTDAIGVTDGMAVAVRAQVDAPPLSGGVTLTFMLEGGSISSLRLTR
jgi:hypothetical protein